MRDKSGRKVWHPPLPLSKGGMKEGRGRARAVRVDSANSYNTSGEERRGGGEGCNVDWSDNDPSIWGKGEGRGRNRSMAPGHAIRAHEEKQMGTRGDSIISCASFEVNYCRWPFVRRFRASVPVLLRRSVPLFWLAAAGGKDKRGRLGIQIWPLFLPSSLLPLPQWLRPTVEKKKGKRCNVRRRGRGLLLLLRPSDRSLQFF